MDVEPFKDGFLLLRYLTGVEGDDLTQGVLGEGAQRTDAEEIVIRLDAAGARMLDVDDNDDVELLEDGLLILRYLLGVRGDQLVSGALGEGAQRTDAGEIVDYLNEFAISSRSGGDGSEEGEEGDRQIVSTSPASQIISRGDIFSFDVSYTTIRSTQLSTGLHCDSITIPRWLHM